MPCYCRSGSRRGILILPGLGNNSEDYNGLASQLSQELGLVVRVAQVSLAWWYGWHR